MLERDYTFRGHAESRGIYNPEHVGVLYPVHPQTGNPRTDLSVITDPSLSDYERENVMRRLQKQEGSYLPNDLSDDEILSLVPSRFLNNDPVDVQKWRDYLGEHVIPNMSDEVIEGIQESANVQVDNLNDN